MKDKNIKLHKFMMVLVKNLKYNDNKYVYEEIINNNHYILYSHDDFDYVTIIIEKEDRQAEIHGISKQFSLGV